MSNLVPGISSSVQVISDVTLELQNLLEATAIKNLAWNMK